MQSKIDYRWFLVNDNIHTLCMYLQNTETVINDKTILYGQVPIKENDQDVFLIGFCFKKSHLNWFVRFVESPMTDLEIVFTVKNFLVKNKRKRGKK
jgi:hypothetical protein